MRVRYGAVALALGSTIVRKEPQKMVGVPLGLSRWRVSLVFYPSIREKNFLVRHGGAGVT